MLETTSETPHRNMTQAKSCMWSANSYTWHLNPPRPELDYAVWFETSCLHPLDQKFTYQVAPRYNCSILRAMAFQCPRCPQARVFVYEQRFLDCPILQTGFITLQSLSLLIESMSTSHSPSNGCTYLELLNQMFIRLYISGTSWSSTLALVRG